MEIYTEIYRDIKVKNVHITGENSSNSRISSTVSSETVRQLCCVLFPVLCVVLGFFFLIIRFYYF